MKYSVLIFILALFASCASVSKMSKQEDEKAKTFKTDATKAGLYVYRNESFGGLISMHLYLDGSHLAQTGPGSFVYLKLKPGKYKIRGEAENKSEIEVNLKAGKNTYVWQEVKLGFITARNKLKEVDESKGKSGVLESERIQVSRSPANKK